MSLGLGCRLGGCDGEHSQLQASLGVWGGPVLTPPAAPSGAQLHLLRPPEANGAMSPACLSHVAGCRGEGHLLIEPGPGSWLMLRDCLTLGPGSAWGRPLPNATWASLAIAPTLPGVERLLSLLSLYVSGVASAALGAHWCLSPLVPSM